MQPKELVFQQAKNVKLGKIALLEEFQALAAKVAANWQASLINGDVYEYVQMKNPMRLRLILHSEADIKLMPIRWEERQEKVAGLFKRILQELGVSRYASSDLTTLEVDYFSFEDLVFQECVDQVDTGIIRTEFADHQIQSIRKFWKYYTVFFPTNEAVKANAANGVSAKITARFQELAAQQDEFGVMEKKTLQVNFDSKENFDKSGGDQHYYR